jgi:hypothetical protein
VANVEKGSPEFKEKIEQKLLKEELKLIPLLALGGEPTLIDDGGSIRIRKQRATWQSLWE